MNATLEKPVIGKAGLSAIAKSWPARRSRVRQAVHSLALRLQDGADSALRADLERAEAEALLAELRIVELENRLIAQAQRMEVPA